MILFSLLVLDFGRTYKQKFLDFRAKKSVMSRQSIGSNYSVEERNEMIIDIETKIQKQMHALV